jgi:two-component system sensor histidine kinase KdpD
MGSNLADNFIRLIRRSQRGRLKIYLGYAAGVGKTYQMLLEGHRIKADGIDLAIGLVETHGRMETEALVEGLEIIPCSRITYRGIIIEEMDLAAILLRRPGVVLVDELAHTNIPGSKNSKRYQDIEELLAAGIHVISTLNIQHLESLYETVERATAVKVRERIPDRIVSEADQLVNVDITVEDLQRRLKEGKVYTQERIETALGHFFRSTNLEQLRELTLRELASQIDSRRRDPHSEEISSSPDQVMVCLSSRGPNSEALLRYASRLAGRLNRNWYAMYVQTSEECPIAIDAMTQRMLSNTLTLAKQLGATVFTYKGDDVAKTILQFAREYLVGHIVIGTPGRKVSFWKRLRGEVSLVEKLITEGSGITVVVPDTRTIREELPTSGVRHSGDGIPGTASQHLKDEPSETRGQPGQYRQLQHYKELTQEGKAVLSLITALVWEEPIEKEKAIRRLLDSYRGVGKRLRESAWKTVIEREQQGGTFVGEDVVIPHARVDGISRALIAIGVGKEGIQCHDSGRTARIIVLLLSPVESPENHLEMLGTISRMAGDDLLLKSILVAADSQTVRERIHDWAIKLGRTGETSR